MKCLMLLLVFSALALHRSGLGVPKDLSLIGFDDPPNSAFTLPPLTSVRQSVYEIGVSAANAMIVILTEKNPLSRLVAAELVAASRHASIGAETALQRPQLQMILPIRTTLRVTLIKTSSSAKTDTCAVTSLMARFSKRSR